MQTNTFHTKCAYCTRYLTDHIEAEQGYHKECKKEIKLYQKYLRKPGLRTKVFYVIAISYIIYKLFIQQLIFGRFP